MQELVLSGAAMSQSLQEAPTIQPPRKRGRPRKAVPTAEAGTVPHTVILPVGLCCEVERALCERVCAVMETQGTRTASTWSQWFRDALAAYLEALAKGKVKPALEPRPRTERGIQTTLSLETSLSLALADEQHRRTRETILKSGTRTRITTSDILAEAARYYLGREESSVSKRPAAKGRTSRKAPKG